MEQHLNKARVIREAARKLESSTAYQWGHMGLCNCGFLAQQITSLSKAEIHRRAMLRHGDWSEQLNDYCATSGLPMDDLITELLDFGFTRSELAHLERLSDPQVLEVLPKTRRHVIHNNKADVVIYMNAWADLLEGTVLESIELPTLPLRERLEEEVLR